MKQLKSLQFLQNVPSPRFKSGKLNPNFIDGRSKKINTCKCGKKTSDYRNKLCLKCFRQKLKVLNKTLERKRVFPTPRYGADCNFWKGDRVGYKGIHCWLNKKFGRAQKCGNIECDNTSNWFEWCLKKGKKYERKRENFINLCRKCHKKYDKK